MSTRKARRYLEAKQEYETLLKQREQYPELTNNISHARLLTEARAAMLVLLKTMTGGEIGYARRLECTPAPTEEG